MDCEESYMRRMRDSNPRSLEAQHFSRIQLSTNLQK
ncbi:MAG: hypothetical protein ACI9EV_002349, partial [Urechidicola sp.]